MSRALQAALVLALLGAACPKPGPPPQPLPPVEGGAYCATAVVVTSEDVCLDTFTPSGVACVRCRGCEGGYVRGLEVYCVSGRSGCLGDPLCSLARAGHR